MSRTAFVDLMSPAYALSWALRQQDPTEATPTMFPSLNAICGDDGGGIGLAPDWFVTIGGGTNQGKSLLAQNMAAHAMKQGRKIGFMSLEMSHHQLTGRFYAMMTGTPIKSLERGRFDERAYQAVDARLWDAAGKVGTPSFYVNSDPLENIEDVMAAAFRMRDDGVNLIVLDYLQLVGTGDDESIYKQVTQVAGNMRRFAHKEGVCVLALSQYNTPTGRDTESRPTMYGLMGGGTVANNSDLVLLLDHSRYKRDRYDRKMARTFVLVAKNRHGETGEIRIAWDYHCLQVREAQREEYQDWEADKFKADK